MLYAMRAAPLRLIVPGRRAAVPPQMHNAIGAGTPIQCGFDLAGAVDNARQVYPDIITLQVSARSGEGLEGGTIVCSRKQRQPGRWSNRVRGRSLLRRNQRRAADLRALEQLLPACLAEIADQAGNLEGRTRLADKIALYFRATFRLQQPELLQGLDALRRGGNSKAVADAGDGADDSRAVGFLAELPDEALIDLDLVEGEAAQVAERRIPGTKIVHRSEEHT